MRKTRCTWDDDKAAKNLRKHRVSFEEAATALDDPLALVEPDSASGELRFDVLGTSDAGRVLFVVTIVYEEDVYHLISARKAERHERKRYEEAE